MKDIFPKVKEFNRTAGSCQLQNLKYFRGNGINSVIMGMVKEKFPSLSYTTEKSGIFAEFSAKKSKIAAADPGDGFDAYVIQISEDAIRIDAKSESALFYGLQTLFVMIPDLPCGTLRDEGAMKLRMVHWDLKGYQPKLNLLLEELRILASWKINSVLLELEDKYDYQCAPGVGCPGAYSFEDLRKVSKYAAALHIMIIPKLQCIAHVDYIQKQKAYSDLRENGHIYQYCSSNPKVKKLWEAMAKELMECFAEHPQYFHIGADEATNLGECPKCKKLGKVDSYLKRVIPSIQFLLKHGRTPVMWDDILRNKLKHMTEEDAAKCRDCCKQAVLMYWAYGYGGMNNTFPFMKTYLDAGYRVWGASGFSGCDVWGGSIPPLSCRYLNLDAWAKSAIENKLEGLVATGWTRICSCDLPAEPQESSWFTILYAASTMWSGKPYDISKFITEMSLQFYGEIPEPALINSILDNDVHPYPLSALKDNLSGNPRMDFLRLTAAAEGLRLVMTRCATQNQYYYGRLGKVLEDYRVRLLNTQFSSLTEQVAYLKEKLTPMIRKYYVKFTADDFLFSRFAYVEKMLNDTLKLIRKTKYR